MLPWHVNVTLRREETSKEIFQFLDKPVSYFKSQQEIWYIIQFYYEHRQWIDSTKKLFAVKDAERCLRFFPKFFDLINFWYFLKIKIYTQNLSIKFFKFQKFRKKHL